MRRLQAEADPVKRGRAQRLPPPQRREQLLDAALRIISERGYRAATMEAIAREAGVSKPVPYALFGDRGALLHALLRREEQAALERLAAIVPGLPAAGADPDELLVDGVRRFLEAVREEPVRWRLILRPAEGTPAVVHEHVDRGRRAIAVQLEQLLRWGIARRKRPRTMDVELVARLLIAFAEQSALLVLNEGDRFGPGRVAALVRGLLRELAPERAEPQRAGGGPPTSSTADV